MDLLGSILDSMEKPPQTNSKQEEILKKQRETLKKIHELEKEKLKQFRDSVECKLLMFINDNEAQKLKFEPMEKLYRTIIHDIADKHHLVDFSFGIEELDRHTIVYKPEFKPTEEELETLRKGDVYDRKLKELQAQMKKADDEMSNVSSTTTISNKQKEATPSSSYKLKYANLIGLDVGQAAARAAIPKEQFGMVPSSNKRDLRSIEQIMNESKMKKLKNS